MKPEKFVKSIVAVALFLLIAAPVSAQNAQTESKTQITSPSQNLKLTFRTAKRVAEGVEMTFLVTNLSSQEVTLNLVGGQYQTGQAASVAWDDDGNTYELNAVGVSVGNKSYTTQYCTAVFPSNVPVKCHMLIRGVVTDATSFNKVKLCVLCNQLAITNVGTCFELNHIAF